MPLVTASSLARFKKCQASAILPKVSSTSSAAERGTWIHSYLSSAIYLPRDQAVAMCERDIPVEHREVCLAIDIPAIMADIAEPVTESAYALDPRTRKARYLGRNMGRDYGAEANEIAGSEDIIGKRRLDGIPLAADFKSGEWVGPVKSNAQVGFFAAILMLLTGASECEGRIIYILEDGTFERESANFSFFDVEDIIASLAAACQSYDAQSAKYALTGNVDVFEGDHCQYCPAISSCPAKIGLARGMLSQLAPLEQAIGFDGKVDDHLTIENRIATLSTVDAGRAWELHKRAGELYFRINDGLKEYAKALPFTTPSGKLVAASSFKKQFFSSDTALSLLKELGATPEQVSSCYKQKTITTVRELKGKKS